MVERQEAMRRKTAEIEADLRTKTELAKTRAEAEGRILQERQNHDLILEKVRLEAVEQRDTVLKAISDGGKMLGEGMSSYLTDGEKLRNTAFMVSLAAVGIYSAKTAAGIAGRFVEVSFYGLRRIVLSAHEQVSLKCTPLWLTASYNIELPTSKRRGWENQVSFVKLHVSPRHKC